MAYCTDRIQQKKVRRLHFCKDSLICKNHRLLSPEFYKGLVCDDVYKQKQTFLFFRAVELKCDNGFMKQVQKQFS